MVCKLSGGVGILCVLILHLVLLLPLLTPSSSSDGPAEDDSKSLWHIMAESLLSVEGRDRDRFLQLCLKRRVLCHPQMFKGPTPDFHWRDGATPDNKNRFWHAYRCVYNKNLTQCPVDGEWSPWSPWSKCSATCDATGNQSRSRTCSNPVPVRGGQRCQGSTLRSRPCLGMCKNNTDRGGLEGAEQFLKSVHEAYPSLHHDCYMAHCTYGVLQRVIIEKFVMAKYWSSLSCVKFGGACPVDGRWSPWSTWSRCSLQCGSGSRTRFRTCDDPQPAFAGHPCKGEFHDQQSCVKRDCGPASTETFTEWTKWTPCSVSCGAYGVQKATRVCLRHAGCDLLGVLTPYVNRSRPCYKGQCPTQGGWSEWGDWTECSSACGVGRQSRMRLCDSPFSAGGLYCVGHAIDFRLCKGQNCAGQRRPTDKQWHSNQENLAEEVLLGRGDKFMEGPLNPRLEGLYTPWGPWNACTESCGKGRRLRKRWCSSSTTPLPPCEGEVKQVQFCNVFVCPVLGQWGVWLPWTPCSKTCGEGRRQRYRECNNPLPQFGGSCLGDSMKVDDCEIGDCPNIVSGTWSDWVEWSRCSVSCGGGNRNRRRARQRYSGDQPPPSNQPDPGSEETLDCNTQPCPVSGSWAEWGEWSKCSTPCGLGWRVRDRTCTDPSPVFGGTVCPGPGTDLLHCFAGPCKDQEDRAVFLGTTSWIRFAPHNRPARFLLVYLHFKPMAPAGALIRRYRQCRSVFDDDDDNDDNKDKEEARDADERRSSYEDKKADEDEKCQLVVDVRLKNAEVVLSVLARGARLDIHSPVALSLGSWHEVLVEVLKSGASLRVNNHERLLANFSRQLFKDLDLDSYMVIGAPDNNTVGAMFSICSLSINFRAQDLYSSTDWQGQGTPVGRHSVSVQSINPSVQLPHFHGLYYSPLRLYHTERLSVRLTLALDGGQGLLLYCPGVGTGTQITLGIRHARFVVCMVCTRGANQLCHHGDLLRLHQWYHISLMVEGTEAELRVDQGKALQLTCKGLDFIPKKFLYIGGRSPVAWPDVQRMTNYTEGFHGVLGTVVVNGRTLSFRRAVLMGRDDRINLDGYSRATRITPVFEHRNSIVVLHCEVTPPPDPATEVKVVWLLRDTVLEPSDYVEIVKPVGLVKRVSTLQLKPGGHTDGVYSCVISRDGRLELNHVFPVFRHAGRPELYEGQVEWVFLKILLILLPILAILCIGWKFRHQIMKLLGRRWPGGPPLATEPLEVWRGEKAALHGEDAQGTWDTYLTGEHEKGTEDRVHVVSFGPATTAEQHLPLTPGTESERPLQVTNFGQVKLGDNPNPVSGLPVEFSEGEGEGMGEMLGGPAPGQIIYTNPLPLTEDPVYANVTHNRPWLVTNPQHRPIKRRGAKREGNAGSKRKRSTSAHAHFSTSDQRGSDNPRVQKSCPNHRHISRKDQKGRRHSSPHNRGHSHTRGAARRRSHSSGERRAATVTATKHRYCRRHSHSPERYNLTRAHPHTHRTPSPRHSRPFPSPNTPTTASSPERCHHVPDPDAFFRHSPSFDLRQYQRMRVRVPEPVVLGRGEGGRGGGACVKHGGSKGRGHHHHREESEGERRRNDSSERRRQHCRSSSSSRQGRKGR